MQRPRERRIHGADVASEETIRSVPPPEPPRSGAIDCASTVTHAFPSAIVIACGLPPAAIVRALSVSGLILLTVPSPLLATHTDPAPNAIPAGDRPTGIVAVTDREPGSIRTTASSSESTTHTPPAPTVIPVGPLPTGIGVSSPLGSTRTTLSASVSVSHVAPLADRDPGRAGVRIKLRPALAGCPVETRQQARRGRDPNRVALRGDRPGPVRDDVTDPRDGPKRVEHGIDATDHDAARPRALDHPHTTGTGGDAGGGAANPDHAQRPQRPGINA